MDPKNADPAKDPDLPPMGKAGDMLGPQAPTELADLGEEKAVLFEMAVKLASTVARFNTELAAKRLHLSLALVRQLLPALAQEGMIEELWQSGEGSSFYRITQQGSEYAKGLLEACAYIGPAPVKLEAYTAMLRWQFATSPVVKPEHVTGALNAMVLTKKAAQMAGLAVSSGRSLFVYGPSGNGKSSIGRHIHSALQGDYWIPYCIDVGGSIVRVYDSHCHDPVENYPGMETVDHRWVRIKRPMVVVGGELTLDMLDLIYSPSFRFYEAPPHLKSNGGVFLVDDFGRERVSPEQLLNRFITPMEHQVDYFTLRTGQKIQLPLRHVLIIATNLSPEDVTDPAFLRRMGYRLFLGSPTDEQYTRIFNEYAKKQGVNVPPELIEKLLVKYKEVGKERRCCEPRDLIERCKDVCKFHNRKLEITQQILDIAWTGYFGENLHSKKEKVSETAAEREAAEREAAEVEA